MDMEEQPQQAMKPVFHRTKHKHDGQGGDDEQDLDDDDDDDDLDDDDNKWNLRKYAGASLDSLANLYGAGPILPPLLPAVQQGLLCQVGVARMVPPPLGLQATYAFGM